LKTWHQWPASFNQVPPLGFHNPTTMPSSYESISGLTYSLGHDTITFQ
jgi:hypothetical protein